MSTILLSRYATIRILQDAERLEWLGAVGVGRMFMHNAVDEVKGKEGLGSGIELTKESLKEFPGLMKTEPGRELAVQRVKWMEEFADRWVAEHNTENV